MIVLKSSFSNFRNLVSILAYGEAGSWSEAMFYIRIPSPNLFRTSQTNIQIT